MIRVFHGFLGSPSDFNFLKRDGVILHNLYEEIPITDSSYSQKLTDLKTHQVIELRPSQEETSKFLSDWL